MKSRRRQNNTKIVYCYKCSIGYSISPVTDERGKLYCRRCGVVTNFEPTPKPLTMKEMHKRHRERHPNDKISFGEKPVKNWTTREIDELYTKEGYDLSPQDIDYVQKMEKWKH